MNIVGFAIANSLGFAGNDETLKTRILAGSPPNEDDPEDQAYQIYFASAENIIAAKNAALAEAFSCDAIFPGMASCYVLVGDNDDQLSPEIYEKYFKK